MSPCALSAKSKDVEEPVSVWRATAGPILESFRPPGRTKDTGCVARKKVELHIEEEFNINCHAVSVVENGGDSTLCRVILVDRIIPFKLTVSHHKITGVANESTTQNHVHAPVSQNHLELLYLFEPESFIWISVMMPVDAVVLMVANADMFERS